VESVRLIGRAARAAWKAYPGGGASQPGTGWPVRRRPARTRPRPPTYLLTRGAWRL